MLKSFRKKLLFRQRLPICVVGLGLFCLDEIGNIIGYCSQIVYIFIIGDVLNCILRTGFSIRGIAMKVNEKLPPKMHGRLFISAIAALVILRAISWKSKSFSGWYAERVFPIWVNTYGRLTSLAPFSVGEIMLALAVLITAFGIVLFAFNLIRKNRHKILLKRFIIAYLWLALAVSYIMMLNCFILYQAPDFAEKYMKKPRMDAYSGEELAALRDFIVAKCNGLSQEIARDESGRACYNGDMAKASANAMRKLGEDYGQLSGFYVKPKFLAASGFFSQQYIMGYYFPFSMEANINSIMYITNVPPTMCHELAHTKGFINEDDASMIAFLACVNSDDKFLQYCGYLSVLTYVDNDFYDSLGNDKSGYRQHARINETVRGDNIFLTKKTWEQVERKAVINTATVKKASNAFTETTLVMNGVEEGMRQYDKVVGLMLNYYDGVLY